MSKKKVNVLFRPGDRIIAVSAIRDGSVNGLTGVVLSGPGHFKMYSIRFDIYSCHFHSCRGECEQGHGWYLTADEMIKGDRV